MKRLWSVVEGVAVSVALAIPLVVTTAIAQGTRPGPGPEEPRMPQMMERHQRHCPDAMPAEPKSGG